MDKVEYKIRADEIKALIGEGRYADAVKIADTIDWRKVRSVSMLCTISDLYKINRRFEESRDVLLMAYEKRPSGRAIVYSLCGLAIKMGEFVQAVEYYKEFVRIAPRDTGRYILQYKLYEAQEVSLEERIAVLEELKDHDYTERWAYELAYLYHRVGLTTECVEECDEIFLWFGEGRYVMKALELKALHEPLSPEQQDRYNRYKLKTRGTVDASIVSEKDEEGRDEDQAFKVKQPTKEMPPITDEVIRAYNAGEQIPEPPTTREIPAVPSAIEEESAPDYPQEPAIDQQEIPQEEYYQNQATQTYEPFAAQEPSNGYDTGVYNPYATGDMPQMEDYQTGDMNAAAPAPSEPERPQPDADGIIYPHINEIKEPSVDVSDYNTLNLQEALAEGLKEIIGEEEEKRETKNSTGDMQEVFFETQTVEIPTAPSLGIDIKYGGNGPILGEQKIDEKPQENEPVTEEPMEAEEPMETEEPAESPMAATAPFYSKPEYEEKPLEDEVPGAVIHPNASYQMPSHLENILSQESDGQISMAVTPEPEVEKQITGQISIADYMENWEKYKKDQQESQLKKVMQRVADETGDMFAVFDQQSKAGLQEKIEKAISDAIKQERHDKASGRGDWSVKKEDVINAAVAKVMEDENITPSEEPEDSYDPYEAEDIHEEYPEEEDRDIPAPAYEPSSTRTVDFREVVDDNPPVREKREPKQYYSSETEELYSIEKIEEAEAKAREALDENAKVKTDSDSDMESMSVVEETETASISTEEKSDNKDIADTEEKSVKKDAKATALDNGAVENKDKAEADKKDKKDKKSHHVGNREIEERVRTMTPEEKELFGPYIHHKKSRHQIINAIDNLSMDAFTGNAIVTGEEGAGTVNLAKGLIKAVQASDSNFNGKVAKITANTLNKKSTASIFERLANGALIIQRAADLDSETVNELLKILQQENKGLILVMEDTRDDMDKFLDKNPSLRQSFNVRVDIEALDDDSLVAYAKQYAYEKEYSIDNLGILALHQRISERQTLDHEVTVAEVKDIIDDAIYYAEKRNFSHFVDVIVNKRYDENDMVILREKDFMH